MQISKKLYQQYLLGAYVKILDFCRFNQKKVKTEEYATLKVYIEKSADKHGKKVGKTVVLPSKFEAGKRSCIESYHDGMAMLRRFGNCIVHMFTCNLK